MATPNLRSRRIERRWYHVRWLKVFERSGAMVSKLLTTNL
jgi:hypothetical protein